MNHDRMTCDPERIELFLQQKLSDEEQTAFESHLDDCTDCRRRLEAAAAGDDVWSGVRDSLRGQQLPPDSPQSGNSTLDSAAGDDGSSGHATVLKLLTPTDDDRMLGRLGTYEVAGVVGSGGMGVVLKAFDAALNRYVAIKVLAPHLGSSGAARKRFSREAQAAAAVVHDNVMEIYGVADTAGLSYLVMPYVRGPSLQRRLDDDGPLAPVEILRIAVQAAAGLAAAHAQGLVHRDVKPANILLADGVERVKLTDFGLARAADDASLTKTGIIAGTPQYMSPEQARGESVDQRSDLFSLGSVLYAMCTGRAPFRAETSYGVLRRITDEEPRPIRQINPEIPEWLCSIVAKLMAKQPSDRFQSAHEVAELLEECLAHVQQPTVVPLPVSLVPRSKGRRTISISRRSLGAIAMIAALGLGLLGMVLWQSAEAPDAGESRSTPGAAAAQAEPAESQPKATDATPRRIHHFAAIATGNDVRIAYSADGGRIAVANANPTMIMQAGGTSRVSGDWKPSVGVLDAETGKIIVSLMLTTADEDAVLAATERVSYLEATAIAFSPDGGMVAVGTSIGQVKLFNARTGGLVRSLDDEAARLADQQTPENWKSLRRAMGSVAALAFSPNGRVLATCGGSFADFSERFDGILRTGLRPTGPGRLKVWDVQTGTLTHDLVGHNNQAYAVAFSPDGRLLASAGRWMRDTDWGNGVILWDPRTGTAIHSLIRTTANGGVRSIAFSPDGKMLAMGTQRFGDEESSTGGASLFHVSSGTERWLVTVPGWARPVAFSPDGKSVAVLCGGRSVRFLETETGAMEHEIHPAESQDVRWDDFAIASQGRTLAIGAVDNNRKGSAQREVGVEVWSTRSSDGTNAPASISRQTTATATPKGEPSFDPGIRVGTMACSLDGKLIAVGNDRPTMIMTSGGRSKVADNWQPSVRIVHAETGKPVVSLKLTTNEEDAVLAATERVSHIEVKALAFSPDGNVLAVGTSVGQVRLFNARTGELMQSLDDEKARLADQETPENWRPLRRAMGSVASLAYSPDGSLLAACGGSFGDFSRVFDGAEGTDVLATGPGRLKVWEVKTGTLKHDLVGHSDANGVSFSPDGSLLASAGRWLSDGESGTGAIIWNAQTGTKLRTVVTEANGGARFVAFSPDGKLMAISSLRFDLDRANDSGTSAICLAHVASGVVKWQRTLPGLAKPVAFPDGDSVAVLCGRQSIRFLASATGEMLAMLDLSADPQGERWNDFAIAKGGRMLAVGGTDGERRGIVKIVWDYDGPQERGQDY